MQVYKIILYFGSTCILYWVQWCPSHCRKVKYHCLPVLLHFLLPFTRFLLTTESMMESTTESMMAAMMIMVTGMITPKPNNRCLSSFCLTYNVLILINQSKLHVRHIMRNV